MKLKKYIITISIIIALLGFSVGGALFFNTFEIKIIKRGETTFAQKMEKNIEVVKVAKTLTIPRKWKEINALLLTEGVIDKEAFESIYAGRGGMSQHMKDLVSADSPNDAVISENNSAFALNLFWALGLANKNVILEEGPMVAKEYGGKPENFASTGGWSIARGNPMDHYSKHAFVSLTKEQQEMVEDMAKHIYRPCCNNSTHFPDCNHGMAMLGFLEFMASNGYTEEELYDAALTLNSFWFPDTYQTINNYLAEKGIPESDVSAKMILGKEFSSASGYRAIVNQVTTPSTSQSGGCSV